MKTPTRPQSAPVTGQKSSFDRATCSPMNNVPEGFARARYALRHAGPLTAAEKAEYNAQRAREMRRAEARREPSPQLELSEAA